MSPPDQDLVQRLQVRNAGRERATIGGVHPRKVLPPVAARALQVAERAIGFKLPELARVLYLKIRNDGFGPEYGIVGTRGGAKLDGCTLEMCCQKMVNLESENSVWCWPKHLMPLANYGCGMWSCVDCEYYAGKKVGHLRRRNFRLAYFGVRQCFALPLLFFGSIRDFRGYGLLVREFSEEPKT